MKIVIAPDSFKESLSAEEACAAIAKGVKKAVPRAEIISVPMADGGEGTLSVLVKSADGKFVSQKVTGPLGKKVTAKYGLIDGGKTAVIEMAEASGLPLVPLKKRNPMVTTSFGTGELIRDALERGARRIILTLGGVATNDAGAGIAEALGYRLLDSKGKSIPRGAEGLLRLKKIDPSHVLPQVKKADFVAAVDVDNPLCGPRGSAAVYGPQKGATPEMVKQIDKALRNFSSIIKRDLKKDVLNLPGAGAAGATGAGAVAFLDAELRPGVAIVIEAVRLEEKIKGADLVITGEGKIDYQTLYGKTVSGVAKTAKHHGVPAIALCGISGEDADMVLKTGIRAIFAMVQGKTTRENAMKNAKKLLETLAKKAVRTFIGEKNDL